MIRKKNIFTTFLFLILANFLFSETALNILKKSEERLYGEKAPEDMVSIITMKIEKQGNIKIRKMKTWAKNNKEEFDWRLIKFIEPSDVRGAGFLSLSDTKMYVYLPEFHRIRRIASSNKKESFFGSDFSYDDMGTTEFSKYYTPELKSENGDSYVLLLKRKAGSKKPYSKIELTVSKSNYMPVLMKLYDNSGNLWKIAEQKAEKVGKYWVITYMKMKDVKRGSSTEIMISDIKVNQGLKSSIFTKRFLKKKVR